MNILKINGQALEGIYVDAAISFNKPAKRVSTYSVPGRNGDLVIDEGTFDNVLITYPVFEKSTFPTEFDEIVNYLASLEGYQRIECSNDPQHYRLGRFVVPQNPTAKRLNRDGYWQLSFDCKPQRWLLSGEEDTEIDANPIDEYSGDIVSIDAVALDEITELKAAIEPVQDLNGQTSPFPAGGGPNLYTGTYTPATNRYLSASSPYAVTYGVPSERSIIMPCSPNTKYIVRSGKQGTLRAGSFTSTPMSGNPTVFATAWSSTDPTSLTITTGASDVYMFIQFFINGDDTNYGCTLEGCLTGFYYAVYENICPISGHTDAVVTRTGKNWVDTAGRTVTTTSYPANLKRIRTENCSATKSGDTLVCTDLGAWAKVRYGIIGSLVVGQEYTLSAHFQNPDGRTVLVGILRGNGWVTSSSSTATSADMEYTFVYDGEAEIGLMVNNTASAKTGTVTISNIQLELGSTATAYEPYAGQTYPISLGQTVYGGTLNVTTGVLTITHKSIDLGDATWTAYGNANYGGLFYTDYVKSEIKHASDDDVYTMCSSYLSVPNKLNGSIGVAKEMPDNSLRVRTSDGRVFIRDDAHISDTGATFKTAVTGQTLVYELATPTTVQLTAAEVELLLGQNNIWADTGDVEVKVTTPTVFNNPSPFNSKPLIRVYGVGTFRVNDITVTIASHDKPYIDIDCELQECYCGSENMNEYVSFSGNDFPELQPGDNYMLLASGITKLIVTPRWWIL